MDRIDELTADIFNFLIQLRRLDPASQPAPESIQQRVRSLLDTMSRRAADMGMSREDILEMTYAIVALADEAAIFAGGNLRNYWQARPLQLQYFNSNTAGDDFFVRVNALRTDPRRIEVVRVYYMCLVLGFQGRYRVRGGEAELAAVMDALSADLARAGLFGPELLSTKAEPPAGEQRKVRSTPLPIIGLAVGAVVLSLMLYIGLRLSLASEVNDVVQRINRLVQS